MQKVYFLFLLANFTLFLCIKIKKKICIFFPNFVKVFFLPTTTKKALFPN